ncbi:MAG: DUF559 domain-containing protein [bacterium]
MKPISKEEVFRPIGTVKNHARSRRIMRQRTRSMKRNMSAYQEAAVHFIKDICEAQGLTVHFEKSAYCHSVKRFYVLDVYIVELRLCIEIDDPSHAAKVERDEIRTQALESDHEIMVVRFDNEDVEDLDFKGRIESVIDVIREARSAKVFTDRHLTFNPDRNKKRKHRTKKSNPRRVTFLRG